jgi:hypothetical protein
MTCKHRKSVVIVLCLISLLSFVLYAWAMVSDGSPKSFTSNGNQISGWYWLRTKTHNATWVFDSSAFRGCRNVYINFTPLMTNGASGGAGYASDVLAAVDYGKGNIEPIQMEMFNPYRPQDPANSGGIGYQCYGHSIGKLSIPTDCKSFKVKIIWPVITNGKCHIAVKKDCMYLGRN